MIDPIEFKEIYQSGNYEDPHGEYAKRKGISRYEAKSRAFVQLYSVPAGEMKPFSSEQAKILREEWLSNIHEKRKQGMGYTFQHLYGNRGLAKPNFDTSFVEVYLAKQREQNVGYISLEFDFAEIEAKLQEYRKGRAAGESW